ncbi:dethiobiotin synthase [Alteromonas flava]|uniref:dethiobiotin synthase n=1 Tax=Alteromonas flava TaxID=2048003 RepID=UPI000C284626|nr:dethiobiotin synthase [Alteromonas flava]
MLNLFVTGTDTDVGKTVVSAALLQAYAKLGRCVVGYKPISAGCEQGLAGLENADAKQLLAASNLPVTLAQVNPIAFAPPIAPHIAAEQVGTMINPQDIVNGWHALAALQPDVILTEGAGGWSLPLSLTLTLPEVLSELKPKVVLVVGMRLGCLNHALLTAAAIRQGGFELVGWVANHVTAEMPFRAENIATLLKMLNAPLLGEVPFLPRLTEGESCVAEVADLFIPENLP